MNLMDLFIKIGLKDEASKPIEKIGKAVGSGLKSAVKVGTVAIGAASTAIGALVTQSVKAYANYEQLIGGIETLFGASGKTLAEYAKQTGFVGREAQNAYNALIASQNTVLKNAADAYKTAGISANQYMETAISFSGALLKSVSGDSQRAADLTNTAITDMADQANKYGKTVEEISTTYTSIARGNFQTLDNLFGGMFAGTKTGLQEMLKYAKDYRASIGDTVSYSADSYADIVSAIHDVSVAMGVYGTTADEAAKTISGSLGMLKASWKNLVTGLGRKDANLGELFKNVADSAKTAFGNLKPVIKNVLTSTSGLIRELAPMISEELPGLLEDILPDLISAAGDLIGGLADAIPVLLGTAVENLPGLIDAGIKIAGQLINGIVSALPEIGTKVWEALDAALSESKFSERWNSIKEAASKAAEEIGEKWDDLKEKAQPLIDKIQEIWQKFKDWEEENHVLEGAIGLVGDAISLVLETVGTLAAGFDTVLDAAGDAADGIVAKWGAVKDFLQGIADVVSGIFGAGNTGGFSTHAGSFARGPSAHSGGGRFAIGNDYVPYDNYPAMLHKGEAVLTASEAEAWRRGSSGHAVENVFNFYGVSQSDLDYIVDYVNRGLA